ncbi:MULTISPECIES: fumarate reductase cytochrome b subunit [Desulfobacula]|uniref:FrdC2: fumarate reductase, cytochrome b subunit n=2 Tax=Desulfobacula TaxID=28222 RepID=K0NI76_DESTT|nr:MULTISPECIES: fumarate reductase cytochrome b subunit [Desulfobacula]CCK78677.1 FrdC2: fumarate reductase, cytochrome b subunit [Desulfobacula toluolica Tol2]SDT88238.1 succinate dehydrogenase subunit C [Desulfobacula phenolica]
MDSYIIESNKKKSRMPARLDLVQSGTGLILGVFIWMHLLFDSSIILGKGAFHFVSKNLELAFLSDTGHGFPIAVFFAVIVIGTLFIIHAMLGVRKFPISWKQHRIIRDQMQMMNHSETNLWYIQVVTGFIMFFAGSVHLYVMFANPGSIDPYLSADRIVSGHMWPLYLVLLVSVVLHGNIGLYRLCMKWGWFAGKDARKSRKTLQTLKNRLIMFYLTIGILGLLVFVVIGINHRDNVGERYAAHATAIEQVHAMEDTRESEGVQTLEESQEPEESPVVEDNQDLEESPAMEESQELEESQPVEESHE